MSDCHIMSGGAQSLAPAAASLGRRSLLTLACAGFFVGCVPQRRAAPGGAIPPSQQVSIPWLPPSVSRFHALLNAAGKHHRVDANLLAVIVLVESGGQPQVESPAGAIGLMQVMPATGEDIATRRGLSGHTSARLQEPAYNIDFGTWYIAKQLRNFWTGDPQQTVELAAAAYNGGPGRLRRHLQGQGGLPDETRRYRRWVGGMWYERGLQQSSVYTEWMEAGGRRLVKA